MSTAGARPRRSRSTTRRTSPRRLEQRDRRVQRRGRLRRHPHPGVQRHRHHQPARCRGGGCRRQQHLPSGAVTTTFATDLLVAGNDVATGTTGGGRRLHEADHHRSPTVTSPRTAWSPPPALTPRPRRCLRRAAGSCRWWRSAPRRPPAATRRRPPRRRTRRRPRRRSSADGPGLDGGHRQRRRDRLPGRALPGRRLHELRPDRHRRPARPSATPASRPPRATATACAPPTPPATWARTPTSPAPPRRRRRHQPPDARRRASSPPRSRRRRSTSSWTAATDNVGVTGYLVERCQGAGCTNFAQIATPTGTTLQRHRPDRRHQLQLPRARDRCRRQPGCVLEHGQRHHAPARTPRRRRRPSGLDGHGHLGQPDQPRLDGRHRQRRRDGLPGRTLPGRRLHRLRADRRPRPAPRSTTPAWPRRPATATGCAPPTPRATSGRSRAPPPPPRPPPTPRRPARRRASRPRSSRAARSTSPGRPPPTTSP